MATRNHVAISIRRDQRGGCALVAYSKICSSGVMTHDILRWHPDQQVWEQCSKGSCDLIIDFRRMCE